MLRKYSTEGPLCIMKGHTPAHAQTETVMQDVARLQRGFHCYRTVYGPLTSVVKRLTPIVSTGLPSAPATETGPNKTHSSMVRLVVQASTNLTPPHGCAS